MLSLACYSKPEEHLLTISQLPATDGTNITGPNTFMQNKQLNLKILWGRHMTVLLFFSGRQKGVPIGKYYSCPPIFTVLVTGCKLASSSKLEC